MESYMNIANSGVMWVACGLAVVLVLVQAFLFARKSWVVGGEIGISEERMKSAVRSSMIAAIGPSIVILTALLSLLVSMGGPIAWMRLSVIGSVMFELPAAGIGATAAGEELGPNMSSMAFATAVWAMALGSVGWIIFATFSADKMDMVQKKFTAKDPGFLKILSTAAILGVFGYLLAPNLLALDGRTVAALGGAATMLVFVPMMEENQSLREWGLGVAILVGVLAAVFIPV